MVSWRLRFLTEKACSADVCFNLIDMEVAQCSEMNSTASEAYGTLQVYLCCPGVGTYLE